MKKKINIYGYQWTVMFVDKDYEELGKCDGRTNPNKLLILVRNDIEKDIQKSVIRHELAHAILCIQGRCYQRKFDVEELCEFVGFQTPLIDKLTKHILGE